MAEATAGSNVESAVGLLGVSSRAHRTASPRPIPLCSQFTLERVGQSEHDAQPVHSVHQSTVMASVQPVLLEPIAQSIH
eukprot:9904592-Lingulodinium_polyedra.AAC.1